MLRIALILLLFTSCTTSTVKLDETIIKLTDQSTVFKIKIDEELESYSIVANVTGVCSKQTSITINNSDGKIYSYFIGPGDVDLKINTDWYDNECYIKVFGVPGNSGELRINYSIS